MEFKPTLQPFNQSTLNKIINVYVPSRAEVVQALADACCCRDGQEAGDALTALVVMALADDFSLAVKQVVGLPEVEPLGVPEVAHVGPKGAMFFRYLALKPDLRGYPLEAADYPKALVLILEASLFLHELPEQDSMALHVPGNPVRDHLPLSLIR